MAKLLCMEVGTSTVRLAEVNRRGKTVEITKTFVFDTPDDATKDGKVRVSDNVVSAIRDGIDESGIKATDVHFVVDSTKILFKQVELPVVSKKQIQSTLELTFSDYFPVDETLYHISYVLNKTYEKNGQRVMSLDVFAIPNDLSESYYNLAVALGLNGKGLSSSSRSMINLFPNSFNNRNVAMVNINEHVSTLTISVDGSVVFNKTIPHGVHNTIRQVINSPLTMDNIDVTGATELLYTQPILMRQMPNGIVNENDEEEKLHYNVTTSIVSLVKAIESTFTAFLAKENIQIQEFHLSGLGAGFDGISHLLTNEFGIPVTVMQQEGNLKINPSASDDTLLLSCYPCVGVAIDEANFFTVAERAGGDIEHNKKMDRMFIFVGVLFCMISFAYSAYAWLNADMSYKDAYDENTRLTRHIQELRDLGVEIAYNNYSTAVSYNKEVLGLYDRTRSDNEEMTIFLEELERNLPRSARVSSMTLTPKIASVTFVCDDRYVAAGVLHLLRNMDTIVGMDCSSAYELNDAGAMGFTCTFTLKTAAQLVPEDTENGENEDVENEGATDGEQGDNSDQNDATEPNNQLLAESTEINTNADIARVNFGDIVLDLKTLTTYDLINHNFEVGGEMSMSSNSALEFTGINYIHESGIELYVAETDGIVSIIKADTADFVFYNGIRVGMTIDEALAAIAEDDIVSARGYIIVKSSDNTLVIHADVLDVTTIDMIYLINNAHVYQTESQIPDADETITPDESIVEDPDETIAPDESIVEETQPIDDEGEE